jgi:hypothetical protein
MCDFAVFAPARAFVRALGKVATQLTARRKLSSFLTVDSKWLTVSANRQQTIKNRIFAKNNLKQKKMAERTFIEKETGKTWTIKWNGNKITTANNNGKEKETVFDTVKEAQKKCEKEMWAKLKKGFVFIDAEAKNGTPTMHRYIVGGGYTGFMPICADESDNSFYISHVVGQFEKENIHKITDEGEITTIKTFIDPNTMNYKLIYHAGKIFINRNQIVSLDIQKNETKEYTTTGSRSGVLDIFADRAVGYNGPKLTVYNLAQDSIIFEQVVECELYSGHSTLLAAAICHDTLAYCIKSDEITLVNIKTNETKTIKKDIAAYTTKMQFSADGKRLFTQEQFGSWSLKCYNTSDLHIELELPKVQFFNFDNQNKRFATISFYRSEIEIYDALNLKKTLAFQAENTIKNAFFAFTKDCLAVFTDYGCLSLYNIT